MIEIAPTQIYTVRDVAAYFKCSTRKIQRLISSGQLRGFKIGHQRRFKGEEILQFIEQQGNRHEQAAIVPAVQADRLYSSREVAAVLQVSANEAVRLLREGRLSGFRVGMEWRCWGRDLLKLAPPPEEVLGQTAPTTQPVLIPPTAVEPASPHTTDPPTQ